MIVLFGQKYAKNDAEMIDTLFETGGTANGYYKITKGGIYFSDMQGKERVYIRKDGLGPVSVHRTADNRRRYLYGTMHHDAEWFNEPRSVRERDNGVEALVKSVFPRKPSALLANDAKTA